jgi:conjugative transfer signal peptidase TraF
MFVLFHALGYRVNRSDSLTGLVYRIVPLDENESPKSGDRVLIDLSKISNTVIEQGIRRGYVTKKLNQPMLKRIGAIPGDTVVMRDGFLYVNGNISAKITVASRDSYGGELRVYPTPLVLPGDSYWLVSDPERGFDSRYFGPIRREAFTHRAEPVF